MAINTHFHTLSQITDRRNFAIDSGVVSASVPALSLTQTWTDSAVAYTAFSLNVTNTASLASTSGPTAASSKLLSLQRSGMEQFSVNIDGLVNVLRHDADTMGASIYFAKQGAAGNAAAPVATDNGILQLRAFGWNGSAFGAAGRIQFNAGATHSVSTAQSYCKIMTVPFSSTTETEAVRISNSALNLVSGVALQIAGLAYHNPLNIIAPNVSGPVSYTVTATSAGVTYAFPDSAFINLNAVGTYALGGMVKVDLVGATFAANQTITVKLRQTSGTPADVPQAISTFTVPVVTTATQTLGFIPIPTVIFSSAGNETIQIFVDVSVLPSAGSVKITQSSILAIRLS